MAASSAAPVPSAQQEFEELDATVVANMTTLQEKLRRQLEQLDSAIADGEAEAL